jgi:hypothetical protein
MALELTIKEEQALIYFLEKIDAADFTRAFNNNSETIVARIMFLIDEERLDMVKNILHKLTQNQ